MIFRTGGGAGGGIEVMAFCKEEGRSGGGAPRLDGGVPAARASR